jgi:hypothetical protein
MGLAIKSVLAPVAIPSEPPSEASVAVMEPLFNAAGKAPHLDDVIIKQEANWFQLQEEKRQKKNAEKLALQRKKEYLEKDVVDIRNQLALLL